MKLRNRIMFAFLAMVGLVTVYLLNRVDQAVRPVYLQSIEDDLVDVATLVSTYLQAHVVQGSLDIAPLRAWLDEAGQRPLNATIYDRVKTTMDLRIYVMDATGKVLLDSEQRVEGRDFSHWQDVRRTLDGQYGARATWMSHEAQRVLVLHVASPIVVGGQVAGVVSVAKPTPVAYSFFRRARAEGFRAVTLTVLFLAVWGLAVTFWITRPIEKLTRYAQTIRDGERADLPELGRSEIASLGHAFEEMKDALEGKKYVEHYVQTLTHEIKSPLSGIKGTAELLHDEMTPQQRHTFLDTIQSESDRIQRLVDRMLELSVLESRRGLRDVERVALRRLIEDVLRHLAPQIQSKSLQVDLGEGDIEVVGERTLLRLSLSNLIQNAIDFSPTGSRITVDFANDAVTIGDQGPGIPDYARARIFERFYSLKRPDTGRKSSGLGLSIVKEIAELHGGSISIDSDAGTGTTAVLRFGPEGPVQM